MNLYIAAPWIDKDKMPEIAAKFESHGHSITHKWWETEDIPESKRTADVLRVQADLDMEGVITANIVVLFNTSKSEGKAVEQGIAVGMNKHIVAIGRLGDGVSKNVFHFLPNYTWLPSLGAVLQYFKENRFCKDCYRPVTGIKRAKRCMTCRSTHSNNTKMRLAALKAYSVNPNKLACGKCGFSDIRALQLDHIHGGGSKQRKLLGGVGTYSWMRKNNYPIGFQVLCANCNWIKRYENKEHNELKVYC